MFSSISPSTNKVSFLFFYFRTISSTNDPLLLNVRVYIYTIELPFHLDEHSIASRKENSNKESLNLNNNSNPVSRDTRSHHWIGPRIWPSRLTESRQWFGRLDEKWLGDRERNNCIGSLEPRRNYCRGIYPGGTDRCYQFIRGSQPTAKPLNDVLMGPVKGRRGREKRETRLHLLPWSRLDTNLFFFFFPSLMRFIWGVDGRIVFLASVYS